MKETVLEYPIQIENLSCSYGKLEAVSNLNLMVQAGRCYGLFGRNGAGKTTTIRCLLDLIRPSAGTVKLFGRDPSKAEVYVKSRLAYVGDQVAFYPWMSVRGVCDYTASFRPNWNHKLEAKLLKWCELNESAKANDMSRGQKVQLALICAICSEAELLVLDEPTSGLDPVMRREFIRMIIGEFQEGNPGQRTVFISTHLITEFEGLIDEFSILEKGCEQMRMEADEARNEFSRYIVEFRDTIPDINIPGQISCRKTGRTAEVVLHDPSQTGEAALNVYKPLMIRREGLSLEEVFIAVQAEIEARNTEGGSHVGNLA